MLYIFKYQSVTNKSANTNYHGCNIIRLRLKIFCIIKHSYILLDERGHDFGLPFNPLFFYYWSQFLNNLKKKFTVKI